jgi:aminodeoxyfutalosine deaminase
MTRDTEHPRAPGASGAGGDVPAALAELHVHLDGAVEPETLREIEPSLSLAEIEAATAYSDFAGFLKSFVWVNKLLRTPEHYALVARRLFERLASQGVVYAEVTLSAGVILWKQLPFAPIFDALQREAARAPLAVRWIFDAIRQFGPATAAPVFDLAAERVTDGVVAIGLGGDEERGPARDFAALFRQARDRGLRLTCHAGEMSGPGSVWQALEIGAERIGHGIRAAEDPALVEYLAGRRIPLEICITSNVRTGAVASLDVHPVKRLYDAGVPIILNTDDPGLFGCTLRGEYELAARAFGFTPDQLAGLAENAFVYAFDQRALIRGRHA